MKTPRRLLAVLLLLAPALLHAQGTFPPPSAPGVPLMKTLTQVEPRTPIQSLAATAPYNITQSGSYYLTGNITVSTDISAIIVASGVDDVTIDLNGFTIESTLATAGNKNAISFSLSARATVKNGNIKSGSIVAAAVITRKGFVHGIYATGGKLTQSTISGVKVVGVGGTGIYCDAESLVENCSASHCISGILNHAGSITRNSIATNCTGTGIGASLGVVESCRGTSYAAAGISADTVLNSQGTSENYYGILADSIATNCTGTSTSNTGLYSVIATNCTGFSTTGTGLSAKNATNCNGTTSSNVAFIYGLVVSGTATTCQGVAGGATATALKAAIAIGCTYGPGLLTVPAGKTFNM